MKSSQRRRRLRLIQAEGERTAERFQAAASALTNAADAEAAHRESDAFRRKLFVESRAKSRTKLRVEHPGADPLTVSMDRPYLLIGSDSQSDLILDHEQVAARHCFLQWVEGHLFCCDLAPRPSRAPSRREPPNGIWLNAEPISVGPFQLMLERPSSLPEPDYSPLDRSLRLAEDFPQFALQFKGVEQSDNQWPVNRPLTMIGRGSQCKLRLNHPTMPIVQSCLLRTKSGCWLIDIHGAGTTGLNGRTITIAPVDIGDVLQLGPFQVEVVTTVFEPDDFAPVTKKSKSTSKPSSRESDPPSRLTSETSTPPVSESSPRKSSISDVVPIASTVKSQAVASRLEATDSFVGSAVPQTISENRCSSVEPSVSVPEIPTGKNENATPSLPSIRVRPELIAEFVQSQQSQLALLKLQLEQLKTHCETASGRSISKRAKGLLHQSVNEALITHGSMAESIDKLLEVTNVVPPR